MMYGTYEFDFMGILFSNFVTMHIYLREKMINK